tara:strand:- start:1317 stop:2195 length:879 start_codon:yes stop_codon:yes gene_type:complete
MKHRVLDLFSGIGGFSLGLERTGGFETSAFCELDERAQLVLAKHWPDVPIYTDVRALSVEQLRTDGIVPTVITGGFPCTDISKSGPGFGIGITGSRSGLWSEMFRLARDVRPKWIIAENVPALRTRGLTLVLQNLCSIGYCVEWHCIPASAIGALHRRDRIWIIARLANPDSTHGQRDWCSIGIPPELTDPDSRSTGGDAEALVADPQRLGQQGQGQFGVGGGAKKIVDRETIRSFHGRVKDFWVTEPNVGRVAHGVPRRMDRLKQLGNSVVPQIPQLIGECILNYERGGCE